MKFSESFDRFVCFGDTISVVVDGLTITATIEQDDCLGPPWEEHDGHGPVSEWTRRSKCAGERVLCEDRGSKRYYDFQGAIEIAKRDGWDSEPYGQGSKGERAARAVERDFQALRAWCNDEWHWCSVVLSVSKGGVELDGCAASLSGIECNYPSSDNSYLTEVANELLEEAVEQGKRVLESLCRG